MTISWRQLAAILAYLTMMSAILAALTIALIHHDQGDGARLPACTSEDSPRCVWDSATQGNRDQAPDSPIRYVINP